METRARLPAVRLRALSRVSNARGALDVARVWGSVFAAIALAVGTGSVWAIALAVAFVGFRQGALANLTHDAWHHLCFRSHAVNDALGAWLYAYPVGLPFHHDRRRHLNHHTRVGFADDPDWRNYSADGRETRTRALTYFASRLFGGLMVETLWQFLGRGELRIADAQADEEQASATGPTPGQEMARIAAAQVVLLTVFWAAIGWWAYAVFWLLPLVSVCALCVSVRAYVEHVAEQGAPPEARLRDIAAGPIEHFVFSPCHFHFHALHHRMPSIPHYRLPVAKRALIEAVGRYPFEVAPGYLRSLAAQLRRLPTQTDPT